MDKNDNIKSKDKKDLNTGNFKTISNINYSEGKKERNGNGFGKSIVLPFFSGIVGCAVVVGTCFGVPTIRSALFGTTNNQSSASASSSTDSGLVSQTSLSGYSDTSIYAANKVLPSIVGISVEYPTQSNNSIFSSTPQSSKASGSGIIISEDGYILTNNHIVASSASNSYYEVSSASKVTVTLYNDETIYDAKIIGKDEQTDLAVIKIEKSGLTKSEFADSDSVKVGEFAMAVGNPLGLQSSITCGVVSAVNRTVSDSDGKTFTLIQTDAAINSGNSGGALVNAKGQVIGINTLKLSGNGIEGMGFAIPINSTLDITSQLIQYNKVKRPYIGISGVDLNEQTAKSYNLVIGVYVKSIENFSSAEKAGIKTGDVIIEVEGKKITSMDELNDAKNSKKIGDELKLKVNRNGEQKDINLTLGEQP